MSWRTFRAYFLPGIGLAALVIAVVSIQSQAHIEYPLHVWRMDLDDALVGFGTILIGTAAIWTVWLKAKEANRKADAVEAKLNGGLSSMAAQIMKDELRMAGFETGLNARVEFLEEHYLDCLQREIEWKKVEEQIRADRIVLRDLMNERLGDDD